MAVAEKKHTAMSNEFDLYRLPWDLSLSIEEKVVASQGTGKEKGYQWEWASQLVLENESDAQ